MWKYLCVLCLFIVPLAYGEDDYGGYLIPIMAEAEPCDCQTTGVCTCGYCQCEKPVKLVSVLDKMPLSKLVNRPKSLGYGMPNTLAPLADETLVSLQGEGGYALIDQHHQSPRATRPNSPSTSKPASPRTQQIQYRRVYVGMSCGAGGCTPQYRWEPVRVTPISYTPSAEVYPTYDSIGGASPQTYSYGSHGCAGQSGSGCSGSSSGCAGGMRRVGPIRGLFGGWRR